MKNIAYYRFGFLCIFKYFIILFLLLNLNCSENNVTSPEPNLNITFFKISSIPDTIYTLTPENLLITVKTEKRILPNVNFILMRLFDYSYKVSTLVDTLYDNASSGDVVPGDGVFSLSINSTKIMDAPGKYILEFSHPEVKEILLDTVVLLGGNKNLPPVLSGLILPETVSLDSPETKHYIFIDVIDPQGKSDILEVKGKVYYPYFATPSLEIILKNEGIPPEILKNENNYVYIFQPNDIARRGTGEYSILFNARDKKDNVSNSLYGSIYFFSQIENLPPIIEYVNAPDTVSSSIGTLLLEVKVKDVNGRGDIEIVYFNSFLPDGNPSTNNPFYMYDDGSELSIDGGISGDKVKDDGIYSRIISVPPTAKGNYLFIFYAVDKVKNISEPVRHNIVVK